MIIRSEDFKNTCSKILTAVDSNELSAITETLELKTEGTFLYLNVTNREYFAQVKIDLGEVEELHATVNANLFLKLISQITTDTIEFENTETSLIVKGNGKYELPLIFDGASLLKLPEIVIENVTSEFSINSDILRSILLYNSKELTKGSISKPVQKLYYVDEQGAITFTSGACVNSFNLEKPVKLLLNNRLVKLFKLFKEGAVKFTLGYDALSDDIIQTKVKFESDEITLTAILSCDDSLLRKVPVAAIRGRANNDYPYSINISKDALIQTINRLLLFNSSSGNKEVIKPYSTFEFGKDTVTVYDIHKNNKEILYYNNTILDMQETYTAVLDLGDLKTTLESCTEPYLTLQFGDNTAVVITRGNIKNVIPECTT